MPTIDVLENKSPRSITGSRLRSLLWYRKKHGTAGLLRRLFSRLVERVNNKEFMYRIELSRWGPAADAGPDGLTIVWHESLVSLDWSELDQLEKRKSPELLYTFLNRFFGRGATLWLLKKEDVVVGLEWTLTGGFDGFYTLPMGSQEAVIIAVEIFPEFRGQGCWPAMANLTLEKLKVRGFRTAYVKTHVSNRPMQASMRKLECETMGLVRTFKLLGKDIAIWDRESLWKN